MAVALGLPVALPSVGEAHSPARAAGLVRTVTYQGTTYTLRLAPIALRAPKFGVFVQQIGGGLQQVSAPAEHAYLGSVDGHPDAVASGIIASDGTFLGHLVFDRGSTLNVRNGEVTGSRGETQPTEFHWPSADDASRNVSVARGQVGTTSYRWDIGFDVDNTWFTSDPINSSVPNAVDYIELTTLELLDLYETNALLRPAIGRIIIRGAALQDPYRDQTQGERLGTVQTQWKTNYLDADVDDVAMLHGQGGGGVAWVGGAGSMDWGYAVSDGAGLSNVVLRHELGHTWGAHDNHTNGPEGATINSGNGYHRFDGTELSAIMRHRDSLLAASVPSISTLAGFSYRVPPYAALDLVDKLTGGVVHRFRPIANDHDANGDRLALTSVVARSHLGGAVVREGDVIRYVAPAVKTAAVDWLTYVVTDATGKTATGVSLLRLTPRTPLGAPSTWQRVKPVARVPYSVRNVQSGWYAGVPTSATMPGRTVQRASSPRAKLTFAKAGSGYRIKVAGGCFAAVHSQARLVRCSRSADQQWLALRHPRLGVSIMNVATGRCLQPSGTAMAAGLSLGLATCGFAHAQAWQFIVPKVDAWQPATVSSTWSTLTQTGSGLLVGVPVDATGSSSLNLRQADGTRTRFTIDTVGQGIYRLTNQQTSRCMDVYGASTEAGHQVGTWDCTGNTNQQWRILKNPAGGYAVRSVSSGLCLSAPATVNAGLVQQPCSLVATQRWKLS